jgi:hypothetical protein
MATLETSHIVVKRREDGGSARKSLSVSVETEIVFPNFLSSVKEVRGSNHGLKGGFSWFSSVPPGKSLNTPGSFHVLHI